MSGITPAVRLEQITLREIRLPLKEPFRISSGVVHGRRIMLLELRRRRRRQAWSECVAGESAELRARRSTRPGSPFAMGRSARARPGVRASGRGASPCSNATSADTTWRRPRSRWECGRSPRDAPGVPLSQLLGGTRAEIATGISLGIQANPEALVRRPAPHSPPAIERSRSRSNPAPTSTFVRAVRAALGPGAHLMADANNAYTLADADRLVAARRIRSDHDRAAARIRRPRAARRAAATPQDAHLPRRIDHQCRPRART